MRSHSWEVAERRLRPGKPAIREQTCGKEGAGERRGVWVGAAQGPGPFPLYFLEGDMAKSTGPGGSVTEFYFFPGGFSFLHRLGTRASFISQIPVCRRPQLLRTSLISTPLLPACQPGKWRRGAGRQLIREALQESNHFSRQGNARHAVGWSRFSCAEAGSLGQNLAGEGAGVPRCPSCSSPTPGKGKHILVTR